jgi:hypothetical protein
MSVPAKSRDHRAVFEPALVFTIGDRHVTIRTAEELLDFIDLRTAPVSGSRLEPHLRQAAIQLVQFLRAVSDFGASRIGAGVRLRAVQWLEAMGARFRADPIGHGGSLGPAVAER